MDVTSYDPKKVNVALQNGMLMVHIEMKKEKF